MRKHSLYHFSITIHLHLTSFYVRIYLKNQLGEMLIEQIIEFELRGPEPPIRTCVPQWLFTRQNKNLEGLSSCKRQCLTSSYLGKITYKI